MSWPFLFFAGDRLSIAELAGARLDGDVVEIGDAYMPTDAVETRELRAASLRTCVSDAFAVTRHTAAWVHGALSEPPARHTVQRRTGSRGRPTLDLRMVCREHPVDEDDIECIGGVWVTTAARTLADLVRSRVDGDSGDHDVTPAIDALVAIRPSLAEEAIDVLARGRGLRFKRPAIAELRALSPAARAAHDRNAGSSAGSPPRDQEEVTR